MEKGRVRPKFLAGARILLVSRCIGFCYNFCFQSTVDIDLLKQVEFDLKSFGLAIGHGSI
jgi:hypothetical protein